MFDIRRILGLKRFGRQQGAKLRIACPNIKRENMLPILIKAKSIE